VVAFGGTMAMISESNLHTIGASTPLISTWSPEIEPSMATVHAQELVESAPW
jgi:hypothetical protein